MTPFEQMDRRFEALRPSLALAARPSRGWIRAIRQALGMRTGQLARRMNVTQPRIVELEAAEAHGNVTLKSLQRAGEALGCRVVYLLIPERPLGETLKERAIRLAERQFEDARQTMRLENQDTGGTYRDDAIRKLAEALLEHPSRLWDGT